MIPFLFISGIASLYFLGTASRNAFKRSEKKRDYKKRFYKKRNENIY